MMQRIPLTKSTVLTLLAMGLFQFLWLAGIGFTGASADNTKVIILAVYSLAALLFVLYIPQAWIERVRQFLGRLTERPALFIGLLAVVVLALGLYYSAAQRIWTWDEDYNFKSSRIVAEQGLVYFFTKYADIPWLGNQHPPLVPLVNGMVMSVIGVSLYSVRVVSTLFTIGTLIVTYFLGRQLYDRQSGVLSALLLLTFPLVMREGAAALNDPQVSFFFTLSALLIVMLVDKPGWGLAVAAGLAIGAGLISKYTMVFIGGVFVVWFLFSPKMRSRFWYLTVAALVAGLVLGVWLLFAYTQGILSNQSEIAQVNPTYFVQDTSGLRWMLNSIGTRLTSAIGLHNLPLLALGGWVALRRRQAGDVQALAWVGVISLILVLTLPDHRYFMPTFPAMALLMGQALKANPEGSERALLLSLLLWAGALYLYVDWYRASELFFTDPDAGRQ